MKDKKSSIGAKNHPLFLQTDERIRIIVDKINLIVIGCLLNLSKIPTDYFFFLLAAIFFRRLMLARQHLNFLSPRMQIPLIIKGHSEQETSLTIFSDKEN